MPELELTVLHEARAGLGYLAAFASDGDTAIAVGGTTSDAPTLLVGWQPRPTPRGMGLRDVLVAGGAWWACGEYGQLARSRDRGATWQLVDTGTEDCLFGLAAAGDDVWVCGDRGYLARVTGERVERVDVGAPARLASVHVVRDEVIALGGDGTVRRWRAGQVTSIATGAPRPLTSLAISRHGTWIVIGDGGFISRSPDGAWFARAKSGVDADLEAVAALGDGRLVAVGDAGTVLVSADDGRTWTQVPAPAAAHLWSVERSDGGALIGGDGGLVLQLACGS